MQSLKGFPSYLLSRPDVGALALLASMVGLSARDVPWGINTATVFIVLSITIFFVSLVTQFISFSRLRGLPSEQRLFRPLGLSEYARENIDADIWYDREDEVGCISAMLNAANTKYLIVVGKSGVGKSVLLNGMLPSITRRNGLRFITINEYSNLLYQFVASVCTNDNVERENLRNWQDLMRRLETLPDTVSASDRDEIISNLKELITQLGNTGEWVFVFDQAERLLQDISAYYKNGDTAPQFIIIRSLLKTLRLHPNIKTIIALRSDEYYNSLDGLLAVEEQDGEVPNSLFSYFFLRGIDNKNVSAVRDMIKKIQEIKDKLSSKISNILHFKKFETVVSLSDKRQANTFITEMTGYLIEHFYQSSQELRNCLNSDADKRSVLLDLFLARLLDGYVLKVRSEQGPGALSAVLYSLSSHNLQTGKPLSSNNLADICHYPLVDVEQALQYLVEAGVVMQRQGDHRMVHDIISTHVLQSDLVQVRASLKDSIQYLAGSFGFKNIIPIRPEKFHSILDFQGVSLARSFLFFLFAVAAVRVFFPRDLYEILMPFNDLLEALLPGVIESFDYRGIYAIPYGVTLLIYAVYIHGVTYGYLTYTVEGWFSRLFMHLILPIGGGFGALSVFAPSLFVVPIGICGIMMAILLIKQSFQPNIVGFAREQTRRWGIRTFFNIVGSLILFTPALYLFIKNFDKLIHPDSWLGSLGRNDAIFVVLSITSIFFVWAVFHIRPEQGEPDAWNMKLAMLDRSRAAAV